MNNPVVMEFEERITNLSWFEGGFAMVYY